MKRRIPLIFATLILVAMMTFMASAYDYPTVTVGTVPVEINSLEVGDIIPVDISIINNPGIVSFMISVDYDSEYLEVYDGTDSNFMNPYHDYVWKEMNPITLAWCDALAIEDCTYNGTVFTIDFKIKKVPESPMMIPAYVNFSSDDVYNTNLDQVEFAVENGGIDVIPGGTPDPEPDNPEPDNWRYYISLHSSSTQAEVGDIIDFTVSVNENLYADAVAAEFIFPDCFELVNAEWMLTNCMVQDVSGNQAAIVFSNEEYIGGRIFEFSLKALSVTDTEQEVSVRTIAKNSNYDPDTVFDETVNVEISVIEKPPVIIEQDPVVLSEISILDSSYNKLDKIPSTSFVAQVSAQNISHEGFFTVMLAYYDIDGKLLGVRYMYADPDVGKTTSFGASITNADGNVVKVTAMVFDTLNSMKPLTEKKEIVLPFNPNSEELMATLDKAVSQYAEMRDASTRARVQYICDVMIGFFEQMINDANDGNLIDNSYINNYYGDFVSAVKMYILEGEVIPPLEDTNNVGFRVADANAYNNLMKMYVTEDVQQLVIDWFDIDLSVFE